MKRVMSALGLGPFALIIGGTLVLGGVTNTTYSAYQASLVSMSSQQSGAQSIVQAALNILVHMSVTTSDPKESGSVFTLYNTNDGKPSPYPGFDQQKLLQYWQQGNVQLNNVQCAGFVAAALDIAGHPMFHTLGAATDYWNNPAGAFPQSTWQYILPLSGGTPPSGGIQATRDTPRPGDLAVFSNPRDPAGHVAIVVAVNLPTSGQGNGTIVLAQANFPPNYYTLDAQKTTWSGTKQSNPVPLITTPDIPLYVAPLLPDGSANVPDHPLLGYIRNTAAQQSGIQLASYTTGTGSAVKLPNSPWVQVAEADASAYGLDPTLFAKQINQESGFNPNARSAAGAIGIAQFEPGTAKTWGVNPTDPASSLVGAARMMASSYRNYLSSSASQQEAYAKALADYNCGCVQSTYRKYGSAWISHLPTETSNYIKVIMGI